MPEQGGGEGGGGGLMADVEKVPAWVWLGGLAAGAIFFVIRRNSGAATSSLSSAPAGLPPASGPTPYTDASGQTWYPPGWIPGSSIPPAGTTPPGTNPTPVTPPLPILPPPLPPGNAPPPINPTDPPILPPGQIGPAPPPPSPAPPAAPPPTYTSVSFTPADANLPATPLGIFNGLVYALTGSGTPGYVQNYNGPAGTGINAQGEILSLGPNGWTPWLPPSGTSNAGQSGMAAYLQAHNTAQRNVLSNPQGHIATAQAARSALVGQALNSHTGPGQPPGARVPQQVT